MLYVKLERQLFISLIELAGVVERLVEAGEWPEGVGKSVGYLHVNKHMEKYVTMWKRSYVDGLALADGIKNEL